jgi:hypothetical protein
MTSTQPQAGFAVAYRTLDQFVVSAAPLDDAQVVSAAENLIEMLSVLINDTLADGAQMSGVRIDQAGPYEPVPAKEIRLGDEIEVAHGLTATVTTVRYNNQAWSEIGIEDTEHGEGIFQPFAADRLVNRKRRL